MKVILEAKHYDDSLYLKEFDNYISVGDEITQLLYIESYYLIKENHEDYKSFIVNTKTLQITLYR